VRQRDRDVSPVVEAYDKLGGFRRSALLHERTRVGVRTNVARRKGRFAVKARKKSAEREREDDGSPSVGPGQPRNECRCEAATERDEREPVQFGEDPAEKADGDRQEMSAVHAVLSRIRTGLPREEWIAEGAPGCARVSQSSLRIIVTGGAGFIGSHVADAYCAAGHEVVVIDSLWAHGGGRQENVPRSASFVQLDVRDEGIERVFREFAPEVVSHHAAQHSVAISARDPRYDADVNVLGLINVLDNAVKAGVRKVIFASSGATYGEPEKLPITDATPQNPESPYAITKMIGEHYLRFYKAQHGLDFTALRYGNVYGPRQDPSGEAGVIAIFVGRFLAKEDVTIFWDGEQTRDYIYAGDIAQLNVLALDKGAGKCYGIGTNKKTSVNEIYRALVEVTGFEAPIEYLPKRPGDVRDAQIDPAAAKKDLGWRPTTTLLEGMKKTVAYFQQRMPA